MLNYIRADLFRILRRKPRILTLIIMIIISWITFSMGGADNALDWSDSMNSVFTYATLIIGVIEMGYVFGDDFRGKTAQIAIGIGINRKKIILAKWIEFVIVCAFDILIVLGMVLPFSIFILDAVIPAGIITSFNLNILFCIIACAVMISLVMPILFQTQGTAFSLIVYIILSSGLVSKGINLLSTAYASIQKFHLNNYTLTGNLNTCRTRLAIGVFSIRCVIMILIYLIIGLGLTYLIYNKKELEF